MSRIRHESIAQHDNWYFMVHESNEDIKIESSLLLLRCVHCYVLQIPPLRLSPCIQLLRSVSSGA
jgi:hypothetical protein